MKDKKDAKKIIKSLRDKDLISSEDEKDVLAEIEKRIAESEREIRELAKEYFGGDVIALYRCAVQNWDAVP